MDDGGELPGVGGDRAGNTADVATSRTPRTRHNHLLPFVTTLRLPLI